jgi:hypothetical protein
MNGSTAYAEGFQATHCIAGQLSRARMPLLLLCLLLGSCLALAVASVARAAPIPPGDPRYLPSAPLYDENPEVSAEYSGTITQELNLASGGETDTRKATLSWKTKVSGPIDQIEYGAPEFSPTLRWKVEELSGDVTDKGVDSGKNPHSCTGQFSPTSTDGGSKGVELPLDEPGFPAGGGNPETNPDYFVRPPGGVPVSLVASNVTESVSDSNCATAFWNSNGSSGWGSRANIQSGWTDSVEPKVYFPVGGKFTQPVEFSCETPKCGSLEGEKFKVTIKSSVTFSSPGGSSPPGSGPILGVTPPTKEPLGPPTPFDWLPESKRTARLDLDPALENARNYCTPYALGLAGFGAGVLLIGAPGVGATLTVAGSLTALASEPFCVATLKRVADDVKRYRDPPDPNIHAIARPAATKPSTLPSCRRWHGATGRFCKRLRAAETKWVLTAKRVASIDDALSTTTNRLSAALAAGDRSAIAAQSAAGQQMQIQENAALSEKAKAGSAVAAVLRSGGLRFRLSLAQSRATIKGVERSLVKQGISTSTLTAIGSPALKPQAVDLLTGLAR